jgi:hypothetical protein
MSERPKETRCKRVGSAYAGSNPAPPTARHADVAQLVEHLHGKEGVRGSSPLVGSDAKRPCPCLGASVCGRVILPRFCGRLPAAMDTSARRARAMIVLSISTVALAVWPSVAWGDVSLKNATIDGTTSTSSPSGGVLPARVQGVVNSGTWAATGGGSGASPVATTTRTTAPGRPREPSTSGATGRTRSPRPGIRRATTSVHRLHEQRLLGARGCRHAAPGPQRHGAGAESEPQGALRDQPDARPR